MSGRPGTVPKWPSQQFGNRRAIWAGSVLARTMWPGPFSLVTGLPLKQEGGVGAPRIRRWIVPGKGGCEAGCAPDAHIATGITLPTFHLIQLLCIPSGGRGSAASRPHPSLLSYVHLQDWPPSLHPSFPWLHACAPCSQLSRVPWPLPLPIRLDAVILFLCVLTAPASSLDSGYHLIHLGEALSIQ